ncbi:helicase-associated domain-containing protein [Paenibacillus chartarius]|uniref:Helicase-associated domain-containing protein n=1 Tax=Paenibacillus chartarius TaxID=747481 RepID=A0ABV6DKM0_9BACL
MMVSDALRKLAPAARLQLEANALLRRLSEAPELKELAEGHEGDNRYEPLYSTTLGAGLLSAELSDAERTTLRIIVSRFANEPFDEAALAKRAEDEAPGAELRLGLAGLRALGIVVTVRKAWGERLHALPYDALGAWQAVLFGEPELSCGDNKDTELTASAPGALDDDLFALLAFAAKQELILTQKGTIAKRQLQALHSVLKLPEDAALRQLQLAYGTGSSNGYEPGLAIVLDAALRFGLLAAEDGALRVQEAPLRAWLSLPRGRRGDMLQAAWFQRQWPREPLLQRAAAALLHAPRGAWLALPRLAAWLGGIARGGVSAEPLLLAQLAETQWLQPLAALGWLELARHTHTGETLLRIPDKPEDAQQEPSGRIYVQPDFELIVPSDTAAAVRWELERFADRFSSDQVHMYRITKSSVQFACEQGMTAAEIERFLAEHSRFGLPDNVGLAIRQWAGEYGRISFARASLLRCADAQLADELARNPRLAPYLLERLGDTVFVVRGERLRDLQAALDKAGYAPRKAVMELGMAEEDKHAGNGDNTGFAGAAANGFAPDRSAGEPNSEERAAFRFLAAAGDAGRGLLDATDPLLYYDLEPELPPRPERRAREAELRDVPAVWWKDYRTYHASTRKEMIRKAIEAEALLKLRLGGQDRTIAPKRLLEERDSWCIVGIDRSSGSEIRFGGDEWQEMKFVVPGMNDR